MNTEMIVLDDLKMNLIAALITLLLAATYTKTIEIPFKIMETPETTTTTQTSNTKKQTIQIHKQGKEIMVTLDKKTVTIKKTTTLLEKINPDLPTTIAIQEGSGTTAKDLIHVLGSLNQKGTHNISITLSQPN